MLPEISGMKRNRDLGVYETGIGARAVSWYTGSKRKRRDWKMGDRVCSSWATLLGGRRERRQEQPYRTKAVATQ